MTGGDKLRPTAILPKNKKMVNGKWLSCLKPSTLNLQPLFQLTAYVNGVYEAKLALSIEEC